MNYEKIEHQINYLNSLPHIGKRKNEKKIDELKSKYNLEKLRFLLKKYVPDYLNVQAEKFEGLFDHHLVGCEIKILDQDFNPEDKSVDTNQFIHPDDIAVYFDDILRLWNDCFKFSAKRDADISNLEEQKRKKLNKIDQEIYNELEDSSEIFTQQDLFKKKRIKENQINSIFNEKKNKKEMQMQSNLRRFRDKASRNDLTNIIHLSKIFHGLRFKIIQVYNRYTEYGFQKKYLIIFDKNNLFDDFFEKPIQQ